MQHGTMLFHRLESFEYSVSSLTAPTPWSWPHEYAEACAFDSCFLPVTSEYTSPSPGTQLKLVAALFSTPLGAFYFISPFLSTSFVIAHIPSQHSVPRVLEYTSPKQHWLLTSEPHSATFAFIRCFPLTTVPIKERFF